jgi:hypothetical protein
VNKYTPVIANERPRPDDPMDEFDPVRLAAFDVRQQYDDRNCNSVVVCRGDGLRIAIDFFRRVVKW